MLTSHYEPVFVQSTCPTPVGTPLRSMLPGSSLQVHVPSADVSPQTVFGSLDPKGLAALQAAFHDNFADKGVKVSAADAWHSVSSPAGIFCISTAPCALHGAENVSSHEHEHDTHQEVLHSATAFLLLETERCFLATSARCSAVQGSADIDQEPMQATPESDEGLVVGQTEVTTPAPTKEPRPVQDTDSSPDVSRAPSPLLYLQHMPVCPYGVVSTVYALLCPLCPVIVCVLGIYLRNGLSIAVACASQYTAKFAPSEAAYPFLSAYPGECWLGKSRPLPCLALRHLRAAPSWR